MNVEQYINEIKEKLIEKGYGGKKIDYSELQRLHQEYASELQEKDFAHYVLEMETVRYFGFKKDSYNTVVLKEQLRKTVEREKSRIKNELISKGYVGKLISYAEIQKLHQTFATYLPEDVFAKDILELANSSYSAIKSGRRKNVYILRNLEEELEETIDDIKVRLIKDGYTEKKIDYQELQWLHRKYGMNLPESRFAQKVLEISESAYSIAKNKGAKIIILNNHIEPEEKAQIDSIKEQLKNDGYVGVTIDYSKFQELHQKYGSQMPEYQFARNVLEISANQYKNVKKGTKRAIILKSMIIRTTSEEIELIKRELDKQGYTRKYIDYEELKELHQKYGSQMPEYQFAQEVLGINPEFLANLRSVRNSKAKVLKDFGASISKEEIEKIKNILEENGYGGKKIDYSELQLLHQLYGSQMSEEFFAKVVLEIPSSAYNSKMQNGKGRTQILCSNMKIELIRNILFKESRWYAKGELERICKENDISIEKLIRQIASNGTGRYNESYKKVLKKKGKLWIGKTRISNEFLEKNYEMIMEKAELALKNIKTQYNVTYNTEDEDLIEEAVLWLIESAGETEKNFGDNPEIMKQKIFNILRRNMIFKFFCTQRITVKSISLNQRFIVRKNSDKASEGDELVNRIADNSEIDDESQNTDIEEGLSHDDRLAIECIETMKSQIEAGMKREEVINNMIVLFGLSEERLLDIMQNYLIKFGKITFNNGQTMPNTNPGDGR